MKKRLKALILSGCLAVICGMAFLCSVLAKPDPTNASRWPDPSNNGESNVITKGYGIAYLTFDEYQAEDYSSTVFYDSGISSMTSLTIPYRDDEGYCYFGSRLDESGVVLTTIPVPASAAHEEGNGESNGYLLDLKWLCYNISVKPSRSNSTGVAKASVGKQDYYKPVMVGWDFTYGGIEREAPKFFIAYKEGYKMSSSELPSYLSLASRYARLYKQCWDMMASIEAVPEGTAQAGGYHPIYDYMLNAAFMDVNRYLLPGSYQTSITAYSTEEFETLMKQRVNSREGVQFEPAQCAALLDMLEYYINLAEENRIAEPGIQSFTYKGYPGIVDEEASTVTVYLPDGAGASDGTEEGPEIVTNEGTVAYLKDDSGSLADGEAVYTVAAYDRTSPIIYSGKDQAFHEFWGDVQKDYTVTVLSGTPDIQITGLGVVLNGKRYAAKVEQPSGQASGTVTLDLPASLQSWGSVALVELTHNGTGVEACDPDGSSLDLSGSVDLAKLTKLTVESEPYGLSKDYAVTVNWVKSSENRILSFQLGEYEGVIEDDDANAQGTVTVTIPKGVSFSGLTATVSVSEYATYKSNGTGGWAYGTPVEYVVTAEDGSTRTYTVTVAEGTEEESCRILEFSANGYAGEIDEANGAIALVLPAGTNLRSIAPTIQVSPGASVSPKSGEAQDFTNPVAYTVTGAGGRTKTYTVTASLQGSEIDTDLQARMEDLLEKIISRYRTSAEDDWEYMDLGLYDRTKVSPGDAMPYGLDLEKEVTELSRKKMTDYDRGVMMLTALGLDCTKLDEYNGGQPIVHSDGTDISNLVEALYNYPVDDTVNGPVFWLLAMDMGNYTIPGDAKYTREEMVDTLLNHVYGSDGFGLDMVAAIMYSLYPYRDNPAVAAKLQEGLDIILGNKTVSGVRGMQPGYKFYSMGDYNSETASWVICALCSMGIDPHTDPRFSETDEDGNITSVITVWLDSYANETDGYFHHTSANLNNQMATYEGCYALQWYLGFLENGGAGHPYSLYADRFDFGTVFSSEAEILSFILEGKEGVIEGNNITVTLPDTVSLTGLTPEIKLSEGAEVISPDFPFTFIEDVAQPVTVRAADGKTTNTYQVTVKREAGLLASGTQLQADTIKAQDENRRDLTILEQKVTEGSDGVEEILLTFGEGVDLTSLRLWAELSDGATSDVKLDFSQVVDLSGWLTVTVTAEDGTTRPYRIKAQNKVSAKITGFSVTVGGIVYEGEIDQENGLIVVKNVPSDADVTALAPDITLGEGTTVCSPLSGVAQNFANAAEISYTVSGTGLVSKVYTAKVVDSDGAGIAAPSQQPENPGSTDSVECKITSFSINGVAGVIDEANGTISVTLDSKTDLTQLTPVVAVSSGATVSPVSGQVVNMQTPVTYTVTNGEVTKTYVVTVILKKSLSDQLWEKLWDNNTVVDHQWSYDHSFLSR